MAWECICSFIQSYISDLNSALRTADSHSITSDIGGVDTVIGTQQASNDLISTNAAMIVVLVLLAVLSTLFLQSKLCALFWYIHCVLRMVIQRMCTFVSCRLSTSKRREGKPGATEERRCKPCFLDAVWSSIHSRNNASNKLRHPTLCCAGKRALLFCFSTGNAISYFDRGVKTRRSQVPGFVSRFSRARMKRASGSDLSAYTKHIFSLLRKIEVTLVFWLVVYT